MLVDSLFDQIARGRKSRRVRTIALYFRPVLRITRNGVKYLLKHSGLAASDLDRWSITMGNNAASLVDLIRNTVLTTIICMTSLGSAIAAPPENADSSLAPWFNDLKASDGTQCCSMADCRSSQSRSAAGGGYETIINGEWVAVPWDRVVSRSDNPTGHAIVCFAPHINFILCFVPPPDS